MTVLFDRWLPIFERTYHLVQRGLVALNGSDRILRGLNRVYLRLDALHPCIHGVVDHRLIET